MLTNTVGTLYNVFSDPSILKRVRKEAGQMLTINFQDEAGLRTLNMTRLREVLLLESPLQESNRC